MLCVLKITVRELECDAFQVAIKIANEGQSSVNRALYVKPRKTAPFKRDCLFSGLPSSPLGRFLPDGRSFDFAGFASLRPAKW